MWPFHSLPKGQDLLLRNERLLPRAPCLFRVRPCTRKSKDRQS
jgi:hypothetical protein